MIHATTKRVIYLDDDFGGKEKYLIKKEYEGFGLYQEMCPSGLYVHGQYLITDGDIYLKVESYNNYIFDELLDLIDYYNETGEFGVKGFIHYDLVLNRNIYLMHPSGNKI